MSNYAVVCLDETGSMTGQEYRVVTSMNEYAATLDDDTHLTVFKFDSKHWTTFFDNKKSEWNHMEQSDYSPGAATPLYDCIARTIKHAETLAEIGDKVMVMIDTDGEENASTEYEHNSIKALVDQKKIAGWEFWFMANGIDQATADKVGKAGKLFGMNVASNTHKTRRVAYSTLAVNTAEYFNQANDAYAQK